MDWFECLLVVILALMLFHVVLIVSDRLIWCHAASSQSRRFVRDTRDSFAKGNLGEVISVAKACNKSHIAVVVTSGLTAFVSASANFDHFEAVEASQRAFRRVRQSTTALLKLGLTTLSSIVGTAPFIGLLGTVFGIFNSFQAIGTNKTTALAALTARLALSLAMTATGLLVALPALWSRNYLRVRIAAFETEMANAELETISYINAHPDLRGVTELSTNTSVLAVDQSSPLPSCEVGFDSAPVLRLMMWSGALGTCSLMALTLVEALIPQPQHDEEPSNYFSLSEQDVVSPDGRYRASIPGFSRPFGWPQDNSAPWSPWTGSFVALQIIPNDRPRAWELQNCHSEREHYALESGDALIAKDCGLPLIMWRTNEELLVRFPYCSSDVVALMELKSFRRKITVIDSHGKRFHPSVVPPPPPNCY